jgi:hypothetical protein
LISFFIVPGPVISPVAFAFGRSWIYLRWEAPSPPRGELEKYKVEYKLQSAHSHDLKEAVHNNFEECDYWKGKICFKLNSSDGIIKNSDYIIKVSDNACISSDRTENICYIVFNGLAWLCSL